MEITEQLYPVSRMLLSKGDFIVAAGNRLRIKNDDVEEVNEKVPDGKQWRILVDLRIEESSV